MSIFERLTKEAEKLKGMWDEVEGRYRPLLMEESLKKLFVKQKPVRVLELVEGEYEINTYQVRDKSPQDTAILKTEPKLVLMRQRHNEEHFYYVSRTVEELMEMDFIVQSPGGGLMSREDREKLTEAQEEEPRLEHGKDYIMLRNGLRAYVGDKIFVHPADIPVAIESDDVSVNGQYAEVKEIKGNYFIVSLKMYFKASKVHGSMLLPISYVRIDTIQNTQERNTRW